jgi:Fe-S cluster assembly ATP-binding protein
MAATSAPLFAIEGLRARPTAVDDDILKGVDLTIRAGEVHALMGPNGSGKSTLASSLLASPEYEVTGGRVLFKGDDITDWDTEVRGKAGIFLAFQYPQSIQGVSVINFLRQALSARKGMDLSVLELRLAIMEWMDRLDMDPSFADRFLNEGFSGGEKKRNEILQMAILEPEVAILDETDSGLDIDALKTVARGVKEVRSERPELGILAITHYQRLLEHLEPDVVHILVDGRIVDSGGPELAHRLEEEGYESWRAACRWTSRGSRRTSRSSSASRRASGSCSSTPQRRRSGRRPSSTP